MKSIFLKNVVIVAEIALLMLLQIPFTLINLYFLCNSELTGCRNDNLILISTSFFFLLIDIYLVYMTFWKRKLDIRALSLMILKLVGVMSLLLLEYIFLVPLLFYIVDLFVGDLNYNLIFTNISYLLIAVDLWLIYLIFRVKKGNK